MLCVLKVQLERLYEWKKVNKRRGENYVSLSLEKNEEKIGKKEAYIKAGYRRTLF